MKITLPTTSPLMIYIFSVIIGISFLSTIFNELKYLKYLTPFIALFVYFLGQKNTYLRKTNNLNLALALYVLWGGLGFLIASDPHLQLGLKDLFFITSYLIPVCLYANRNVNLVFVFYIYSFCFLLSTLGMDAGGFSVTDSVAPFESSASFVFGLFALFFTMEKKYKELIFAIVLMFLTLKRIALLAYIVCGLLWLLPLILQKKLLTKMFFLCVNSFFVLFIILLAMGWTEQLIIEYTGRSVNYFTLGRFNHYLGVVEAIAIAPYHLLIGNGVGSTYPLAAKYAGYTSEVYNLHSDSLKIFFEHGVLFFILFFLVAAKLYNTKSKLILLYLSVLFITDNVLIYVGVMFFALVIVSYYECGLGKKSN